MKELAEQIKAGAWKPCYLFYGAETFLIRQYEGLMRDAVLKKEEQDMNFVQMEEKKLSVGSVVDAVETVPFLADKRLIYVRNSGLFQAGRKDDSERMAEYVKKIPDSSILVFIEEEIDRRGKLYKAVAKAGQTVEFLPLEEKKLIAWVVKTLRKKEVSIENTAAAYFLRTVGGNMEAAATELDKLAGYAGTGGKVDAPMIDAICTKALEVKIFDLVGAMASKNPKKALSIYRNMLLMKESPFMILSMVTRQFRLVLSCKYLAETEGISAKETAKRLSIRDFIVRECLKQAGNFPLPVLKQALADCLETDLAVKTGQMAADLAVELLILRYGAKLVV